MLTYNARSLFVANPTFIHQHCLDRCRRYIVVLRNFILSFFRVIFTKHAVHRLKGTQKFCCECPLRFLTITIRSCCRKQSICPTEQPIANYPCKRKTSSGLPRRSKYHAILGVVVVQKKGNLTDPAGVGNRALRNTCKGCKKLV